MFIYSLLTPIPRGFISCGQSLNAFGVPAFVISSASGSVPLVPHLPWKEGFFSAPPHVQSVRFAFLRQGLGPLASMACPSRLPRGLPLQQPSWGSGRNLPGARARAACTAERTQALDPSVLDSSPRPDTSSQHGLRASHLVFPSQVNEKQKCPTLVGA